MDVYRPARLGRYRPEKCPQIMPPRRVLVKAAIRADAMTKRNMKVKMH